MASTSGSGQLANSRYITGHLTKLQRNFIWRDILARGEYSLGALSKLIVTQQVSYHVAAATKSLGFLEFP